MTAMGPDEKWARGALALGILALTSLLDGCAYAPRWQVQKGVRPEQVAQALDEPSVTHFEVRPEEVPVIPVRVSLRPCCAFGTHLKTSLGPIPVPFFSIGNMTSVDELGPHKYDSGAFSMEGSSTKNAFSSEKNGLVYTCRGGFIDTAHVRDYADWTLFWATTIARLSVTGGTVELPPEGGKRRVIIRPLPAELLDRYGLRRTAIALAQWLAFQLSIWHEIASGYGFAALDLYPEYVSAFSPEDLYSNLLGIKIAGGMLMQTGSIVTDSLYEQSMDRWLATTLRYLQPVPVGAAIQAMYLVDGVWWDSEARLPDPRLVARRNLDAGLELTPWQVSRAYSSPEMAAWVDEECGGRERPLILQRIESARGIPFADLLTYAVDVEVKDPFPFPRNGSTEITQADFPAIIEAMRQKVFHLLGPGSDRPERELPAAAGAPTDGKGSNKRR
jgi:hypothetical protein